MKKLYNTKLANWLGLIKEITKNTEKFHISNENQKIITTILTDFENDSSIGNSINNIFLEVIYNYYHNTDEKSCVDILSHVCLGVQQLFTYPDKKLMQLALEMLPSLLLSYMSTCFNTVLDPTEICPKPVKLHRRASSISPFNDSRKSKCSQSELVLSSMIDVMEVCLLAIYNHELDVDSLPQSINQQSLDLPLNIDYSCYSDYYLGQTAQQPPNTISTGGSLPVLISQSSYLTLNNTPTHDNSISFNRLKEAFSFATRKFIANITSGNRCLLFNYLLSLYKDNIHLMSNSSLTITMKLIGLTHPDKHLILMPPRAGRKPVQINIPRQPLLTNEVYIEMASIAYYSLFNGVVGRAIEAINALEHRAALELLGEVSVYTASIKNSLYSNPSGQPDDGPLGLNAIDNEFIMTSMLSMSAAATAMDYPLNSPSNYNDGAKSDGESSQVDQSNSPGTSPCSPSPIAMPSSAVSSPGATTGASSGIPLNVTSPQRVKLRSIITNASFRTMKLPEDIPIIEDKHNSYNASNNGNSAFNSNGVNTSPLSNKSEGKIANFKLPSLKTSKTPRFKFDFKNSDTRFEGIKESNQEQNQLSQQIQ